MIKYEIKGNDSTSFVGEEDNSSVTKWHLMKAGLNGTSLDKAENPLFDYVKQLKEKVGPMYELTQKIRGLVPYPMLYKQERRRPNFKKSVDLWDYAE